MFSFLAFYMFAIFIIGSALGVVLLKNPIYSLLLLLFVFFNTAGIFILLKAEFLASILIIIYVGAVAILFLFVIMLINIQNIDKKFYLSKSKVFIVVLVVLVGVELLFLMLSGITSLKIIPQDLKANNIMSIHKFGLMFFDKYYYILIICSLILTVSMIGAVVLSSKDKEKTNQRQNVYLQNIRDKEDSVYTIKIDKEKGI